MLVSGSVGGIVHPPIGKKNTTYIPLIYHLPSFGGEKCYRSHLLGEPFQQPLSLCQISEPSGLVVNELTKSSTGLCEGNFISYTSTSSISPPK